MSDYVVIIRLLSNIDLIAIIVRDNEDHICVEHPYYVNYDANGLVTLSPYCILTNETYFDIQKTRIDFVVTANDKTADKFINMLDSYNTPAPTTADVDNLVDRLANLLSTSTYVDGNSTKH